MDQTVSSATSLLSFAHELTYDEVPEEAVEMARTCLIDTVGVTLAGTEEEPATLVREYVRSFSPQGVSSVLGGRSDLSAQHAGLINGTQAHALDYDDVTYYGFGFHPSVTIVPTVLSVGESVGASGKEVLAAFVAAFELEIRIAGGIGGEIQRVGYHPTATIGSFGAAVAAGRLFGLTGEEFRHALAITASLYSGVSANFGTMTKPLHAGLANRNGILAASLAERGFEGNADLFEGSTGPWPSFFEGFDLERATTDIGDHWYAAEGISIKVYPACGCTHCAIDATKAIRARLKATDDGQEISATADGSDLTAAVDSITVYSTDAAMEALQYHEPTAPLEGKFSMEYCVARAFADGDVTLDHFTAEAVQEDRVQDLLSRVTFEVDESLAGDGYIDDGFPARVVVQTVDERTETELVTQPTGTPEKPVSERQLREKFHSCSTRVLDDDATERAYDRLQAIEQETDVGDVIATLVD